MRAVREDLDIPMPSMNPEARGYASYRVPRRSDGMDANTKRMVIVAGGLIGVFALFVAVWSFTGHRHTGIPVVEADSRPVRVKPDNAGGLQVAGANEEILSGSADEKTAMAPVAEAPALQALRAQEQASQARAAQAAAPPAAVAPAPAPVVPAPVAVVPAAPKVVPAPKPVAPAAKPAPAATVAAPTVAAKGIQVQLAALVSQEAATTEWQRMERLAPAAFAGHKPEVLKFEHDGKQFWRLRTTGFADAAQAAAFCEQVKAHVKGSGCVVAHS